MKITKADIKGELIYAIDDIMLRLEEQEDIKTGELAPWDAIRIESLEDELAELLMDILERRCLHEN